MAPDSDYRIKLPVFEGPLDLLLFLIRKNEIDIYDIPIVTVTQQYIDVIKSMQQLDLEIAGDFFVMAATLMEIKSRMLLPKGQHAIDPNAEDDDAMDPRWELVHQLLQYKKFKEAAGDLEKMATFQRDMLPRLVASTTLSEAERPLRSGDRIDLWNSFNIVLRRLAEKLVVGEIKDEQVTVADQMEMILSRLDTQKQFIFSTLFQGKITLRVLVATFIAVLELARLQKLRVTQNEAFTDIICIAVEPKITESPQPPEAAKPAEQPTSAEAQKTLETSASSDTVTA
ncbi:MAG: segregation/condensation protein A [Nibricoccus sp.]